MSYQREVTPAAILKAGKEKSVLQRHPWIFSSAIAEIRGEPEPGETIEIYSSKGDWLARGAYSPKSQIRLRIWTWEKNQRINREFFHEKIKAAALRRERFAARESGNSYRIVYGESDGLPGLIVDKYDQVLVVQFLSWGVEKWRNEILSELQGLGYADNLFERSDGEVRGLEGMEVKKGLLFGKEFKNPLLIEENSIKYYVDILEGHKTGFYLDQRENRKFVMQYAENRSVLDCFSYTGGMALPCLSGGAKKVDCVDASQEALNLLATNLQINDIHPGRYTLVQGDVFYKLRQFRDRGITFDMIILDPPKFAPTVRFVDKASRGYKDINLLGLKLLAPGGILVTFSCSGGVDLNLFQKIIFGAALDARREVQILRILHQGWDHPVSLNFPESAYLKGFVLLVH